MFLQSYKDIKGVNGTVPTKLDDSIQGFDISTYRKANKVHLMIGDGEKKKAYSEIFRAYYRGSVELNTSIETGAFGVDTVNMLNSFASSPITRSVLQSVTGSFLKEKMSGSFAADYRPYIKTVSPMQWAIPCFLPLCDEDEDGNFVKNIETPINTLHRVYLPSINQTTADIKESVGEAASTLIDKIFKGTEGIGIFDAVQKAWKDLGKDLFGDVIQLNNPLMFSHKLKLWIGEKICIDDVLLTAVKVGFAPLTYADDDGNLFPAYATVDLQFMSKKVATTEYAMLSNKIDKNLKGYL